MKEARRIWFSVSIAVAVLLTTGVAQASLIAYEPFNIGAGVYSTGSIVGQNPTVTGFTGTWADQWGAATISSSGLTYPGLPTSGGMYVADSSRSYRQLATPFDDTTSGTYWMSFLYQKTDLSGGAWQAFEFYGASGAPGEDGSRVQQLSNSWGPVGSNFSADGIGTSGLGATDLNVNLFVYKIDFVAGGSDTVTVWRNPSLGSEPTPGTVTGSANFSFKYFGVFDWNPGAANFDEVRIGTTYADVVGAAAIPEPSTWALVCLAMIPLFFRRNRKSC